MEILQELRIVKEGIRLEVELKNSGAELVDLESFEPCIHVDRFTGRNQTNYIERCFIFTGRGLRTVRPIAPEKRELLQAFPAIEPVKSRAC